jgi:hypothetical protein
MEPEGVCPWPPSLPYPATFLALFLRILIVGFCMSTFSKRSVVDLKKTLWVLGRSEAPALCGGAVFA